MSNPGAVGVRRRLDAHVFRSSQARRVEGHVKKSGRVGVQKINKFIPRCADSNQLVNNRIAGCFSRKPCAI